MKKRDFKLGDKLVDYGRIYQIFKIDSNKTSEIGGKILHFSPYFKKNNSTLVCSIPSKNLEKTKIRKPISYEELKKVFAILKKEPENEIDTNNPKEIVGENQPKKTARIIKGLWLEKINDDGHFTRTKNLALKFLVSRLSEEVAFVDETTPDKAEEKILRFLKT